MALTATATPNVIEDIKNLLHLETAPCHVGSFDRPNIFYKVHYKDGLEALKPGRSLEDISTFIRKVTRCWCRRCESVYHCTKRVLSLILTQITTATQAGQEGRYGQV